MTIYTVGYARLTLDALAAIADVCQATIVDVRGRPVSRKRGFGRRQLETRFGTRYVWRGETLGNKPPNCITAEGLLWLKEQPGNFLLLCLEENPLECHRHEIALDLSGMGIKVLHIYQDEVVEAEEVQRSVDDGDSYQVAYTLSGV